MQGISVRLSDVRTGHWTNYFKYKTNQFYYYLYLYLIRRSHWDNYLCCKRDLSKKGFLMCDIIVKPMKRNENVVGTWEVSEWQVRLGEVSGTNYHCIKNMSLPLTLSPLCLHLPLACCCKIQSMRHTDHASLTHTHTHTQPGTYTQYMQVWVNVCGNPPHMS